MAVYPKAFRDIHDEDRGRVYVKRGPIVWYSDAHVCVCVCVRVCWGGGGGDRSQNKPKWRHAIRTIVKESSQQTFEIKKK